MIQSQRVWLRLAYELGLKVAQLEDDCLRSVLTEKAMQALGSGLRDQLPVLLLV